MPSPSRAWGLPAMLHHQRGHPSHPGNKFQLFSAHPVRRLSGGYAVAEQRAAQGKVDDAGQTTAPSDGRTHPAGTRHPHLAPVSRQGKSNGLKTAPQHCWQRPGSLLPSTASPSPASTLSINNTLNCTASVWIGWGTPHCPPNPNPLPAGSRAQSPLPQDPGKPLMGGQGRNTASRANGKTL